MILNPLLSSCCLMSFVGNKFFQWTILIWSITLFMFLLCFMNHNVLIFCYWFTLVFNLHRRHHFQVQIMHFIFPLIEYLFWVQNCFILYLCFRFYFTKNRDASCCCTVGCLCCDWLVVIMIVNTINGVPHAKLLCHGRSDL